MSVEREALHVELRSFLTEVVGLEKPIRRDRIHAAANDAQPSAISDAQAVVLQQLVRDVNAKHHAPFQTVWTLVNQHSGVSSYRLTPAEAFDAAAFYLQHWIDTGLPPA